MVLEAAWAVQRTLEGDGRLVVATAATAHLGTLSEEQKAYADAVMSEPKEEELMHRIEPMVEEAIQRIEQQAVPMFECVKGFRR